ncbi:MAG TPA: BTAD domain-containing putative transcriptional regulator [Anaerolineae bacterium]
MEQLRLVLLGKPDAILGDRPLSGFNTAKSEALLYYLAVTGRPHSREALADLLWSDMPEARAKRNLTKALSNLRQLIEPYLIIERHQISLDQDLPYQVDVDLFREAIEAVDSESPELEPLCQAVELYQGDFLAGFYVKHALTFEDWALTEREQLREAMVQALDTLVARYLERADHATGIEYAARLLAMDPLRESAHRQMMLLLARSGQRNAALAQYETCQRILAEELDVEPTAETTDLFERLKGTQKPLDHNLPPQPNVLVGREAELNRLVTHLGDPNCRLLTLIGPGGIGKTRLAIEGAAHFIRPELALAGGRFADGIYFVNLAPLTPRELSRTNAANPGRLSNVLASAIADAINFSFHGSTGLMDQLLHHLHEKAMLLVLDNFELLVAEANLLAELLRRGPHLKLLVTSRERLNLKEEWVIELAGLAYPEPSQATQSGPTPIPQSLPPDLENYSAVALFIERARHVRVDFTLSEADKHDVIRICQLVEGGPLAIELAASWLRVLSCAEIVAEIEQSLDFLTTSLRNVPERHRSLRAVFEQSWQMLPEPEQTVFRRLSVFRGGFRKDAAQKVAGASLGSLAGLADKSLLRMTAAGRYEIHDLLRQYAAEKLALVPAEQDSSHSAHCRYYAEFLQRYERQLMGHPELALLAELTEEISNFRACWEWTIAPGRPIAVAEINQCVWSLRYLYARRGWIQEGLDIFGRAVARLEEEKAAVSFSPEQGLTYGQVLLSQGLFYHYPGDLDRATDLYQHSIAAIRQSEVDSARARRNLGLALHMLGVAAWQRGLYAEAKTYLGEGLAFFMVAEDGVFEAQSTAFMGVVAYELGEYAEAERLLAEGVTTFRTQGEFWYEIEALGQLARVRHVLGKRLTGIRDSLQAYLQQSRQTGNIWAIAHTLQYLGTTLRLMGGTALEAARDMLEESVARYRDINMALGMVPALHQLGLTQTALGEDEAAVACFREALELSISSQMTPTILEILLGLSTLLVKQQSPSTQRHERLMTLLTLVLTHPASNRQAQDAAARLLAELEEAGLPPRVVAAARKRGQSITLETIAAEILADVRPLPE